MPSDCNHKTLTTVIIQCAGKKKVHPTLELNRVPVRFVAKPALGSPDCFRPDDQVPGTDITWRKVVEDYNSPAGITLPIGVTVTGGGQLPMATNLYSNSAYQALATRLGPSNIYILSAGWGIVRGDFRIPSYDITFSKASACYRRTYGHPAAPWFDWAWPANAPISGIVSLVGKPYLDIEVALCGHLDLCYCHKAKKLPRLPAGWQPCSTTVKQNTNWQYSAAKNLIAGLHC